MPAIHAFAAVAADTSLQHVMIDRREPGPRDVVIDIAYVGVCQSDIHTTRGDWGPIPSPLVPGHEIVGHVRAVGVEVTEHRVGDRVGVGCQSNSCGRCDQCRRGEESYCLNGPVLTYNDVDVDGSVTQGGYAETIVVDAHFVLKIPDAIPFERAAPLLCAGITLYAPLQHWGAGPSRRVAIVGMGGLGHIGVKLAHALGAEVTVLSQSLSKQADGFRFGADAYYATSDPATFTELAGRFDLILNTVSADIDLAPFIDLLAVDGTLVMLGVPSKPLTIPVMPLIGARRSIAGSANGGIPLTQEMLDFCAEHEIAPEVELIEAAQVDDAFDRVMRSDVRYRFVIDARSFTPSAAAEGAR